MAHIGVAEARIGSTCHGSQRPFAPAVTGRNKICRRRPHGCQRPVPGVRTLCGAAQRTALRSAVQDRDEPQQGAPPAAPVGTRGTRSAAGRLTSDAGRTPSPQPPPTVRLQDPGPEERPGSLLKGLSFDARSSGRVGAGMADPSFGTLPAPRFSVGIFVPSDRRARGDVAFGTWRERRIRHVLCGGAARGNPIRLGRKGIPNLGHAGQQGPATLG